MLRVVAAVLLFVFVFSFMAAMSEGKWIATGILGACSLGALSFFVYVELDAIERRRS